MRVPIRQGRIVNGPIRYHLVFWGVILAMILLASLAAHASLGFALGLSVSVVLLVMIPVYVHFYLLQRFFTGGRYLEYAMLTAVVILGFAPVFRLYFWSIFGTKNSIMQWMADILVALVVTTAIKFVKGGFRQQVLMQEVKAKQLQTELSLLKSQINPHFLFNTLNSIFSKALEHGDSVVADSISHLSHILRYVIYDSRADQLPLDDEIMQIRRFIELQRLRFSEDDNMQIGLRVEGDTERRRVPPMLLAPFVENAFKHGTHPSQPWAINIRLSTSGHQLVFEVDNTVHAGPGKELREESGIGLANVRRRLDLLYPGRHDLVIEHNRRFYRVRLILELGQP